jgi:hypothetical protein
MKNLKKYLALGLSFFFYCCEHTAIDVDTRVQKFAYANKSINIYFGDSATSETPTYVSNSAATFTIQTKPDNGGNITIDDKGILHFSKNLAIGTYAIDVKTNNKGGIQLFANALTAKVSNPLALVSFALDVTPILTANCTGCHNDNTLDSDGVNNYSTYQNVKTEINTIINRINIPEGGSGFMPDGGTALTNAQLSLINKWKSDGLNP